MPIDLGSIQINEAALRKRLVVAPGSFQVTATWPPLVLHADRALDPETTEVFRWREGRVEVPPVEWREHATGTRLHFPDGCRPGDVVAVATPRSVARSVLVSPRSCQREEAVPRLRFALRADLSGRLQVPEGSETPTGGRILLERCAEPPKRPARDLGMALFLTDDEGHFEAAVPAGCLNTSVHVGLFAPVPRQVGSVEAGDRHRLGTLALRPGGAVLAQIVSDTAVPRAGVRVEVVPEADLGTSVAASFEQRDGPALLSGVTDEHGWVRLKGIEPGLIHLRLSEPGTEGPEERPFFAGPFQVNRGEEMLLGAVEWPVPGSLEVRLEVPEELWEELGALEDAEDPPGEGGADSSKAPRFEVSARGHASCGWLSAASLSATAENGVALLENVPPGRWWVTARVRLPSRVRTQVAAQEVEVFPASVTTARLEVQDRLYRGVVTFEGTPVAGRLDFRRWRKDREREHRTHAYSDETGRFEVLLPAPGEYFLRFQALPGSVSFSGSVPVVEFEAPGEMTTIRLPEGRLEGMVTTAEGVPVQEGGVIATAQDPVAGWPEERSPRVRVGGVISPQGRFSIAGLSAGTWQVQARFGELRSEPRLVEMGPNEHRGGVELVVTATASGETQNVRPDRK